MSGSRQHERPWVTVDIVVVRFAGVRPYVLLVKRKKPPFAEFWALPGGFVEPHEALDEAARRELEEETGALPQRLEQLHTFGQPGRDPRGWVISVAYLALLDPWELGNWRLRAASDAGDVDWFALDDLPPLAFDHAAILACAARRLTPPAI